MNRNYMLWRCTEEVAKRYDLGRYSKGGVTKITGAEIVAEAAGCSVDIVIEAFKKSYPSASTDILPIDINSAIDMAFPPHRT